MPTAIFRDEVRALLGEGAQLVDVLLREEYEDEHRRTLQGHPVRAARVRQVTAYPSLYHRNLLGRPGEYP